MNINKLYRIVKCDIVLCNKNAEYEIITNSYHGNTFLCGECFKKIQNLFKGIKLKNEEK